MENWFGKEYFDTEQIIVIYSSLWNWSQLSDDDHKDLSWTNTIIVINNFWQTDFQQHQYRRCYKQIREQNLNNSETLSNLQNTQ